MKNFSSAHPTQAPMPAGRPSGQRHGAQRGVSLLIVIVFVLLSMLLALGASRTALFNEMVVGNDADYQRAFEAAQALLQDAELDIQGRNADGSACIGNGNICRTTTPDRIPHLVHEATPLLAELNTQATRCRNALCTMRTGRQDFWNFTNATNPAPANLQPGEVRLEQMTVAGIGARYGQYTGAAVGNNAAPANPILADTGAPTRGGWYWIEVLLHNPSSQNSSLIVGNNVAPAELLMINPPTRVVYRITALAYGRKPNTMVVLQQTYVRQKLD